MATVALNDGQMESYVELTKNYETTVRTLNNIKSVVGQNTSELRRITALEQELNQIDKSRPCYKNYGRMYLLEDRDSILEKADKAKKVYVTQIKSYQDRYEQLSARKVETEKAIQELIDDARK